MEKTMRAWQHPTTNRPLEENIKLLDVPTPLQETLGKAEILVRVICACLNPADYKFGEMGLLGRAMLKLPAIPGMDFSGQVVAVGSDITTMKPGNFVMGRLDTQEGKPGALAEYAKADYKGCVLLPPGVDFDQAAGVGTAGITAYQTIVHHAKAGDRIFLNGGSGGVGTFGIQFAKAIGCHITVSCSTANVALCKQLGADEVIDYKKQDLVYELKKRGNTFNLVVDGVGNSPPDLFHASNDFLVPKGKFVLICGGASMEVIKTVGKNMLCPSVLGGGKNKFIPYLAGSNHDDLQQIADWMGENKVRTWIHSSIEFEDVPEGYKKLKSGRITGKIIVNVQNAI